MPEVHVAEGTDWVAPTQERSERGSDASGSPEGAWDVTTASYASDAVDTSSHTSGTRAIDFRPDGMRFYIVGRATQNVAEYHLSTAWDLSTAAYEREYSTANIGSVTHGVRFRDDGARMWVVNRTVVIQYDLMTPWDVTTSWQSGSQSLEPTIQRGHDLDLRPDGSMFFIDDRFNEEVYKYNLSTSWDIETASHATTLDISSRHDQVRGIEFRPNGNRMFLLDTGLQEVQQFNLSTPWDITTASLVDWFDVSTQSSDPRGLAFGGDGMHMYVVDSTTSVVHRYALGGN